MNRKLNPNRRIESDRVKAAFDRELTSIRTRKLPVIGGVYDVIHGRTKKVVGQLTGGYSSLMDSGQVPAGCYLRKSKMKGAPETMVAMPFGKFRGDAVCSIKDKGYLSWCLSNVDLSPDLRSALSSQLSAL